MRFGQWFLDIKFFQVRPQGESPWRQTGPVEAVSLRSAFVAGGVLSLLLLLSPPAWGGFHSGGVGSCGGCHVSHASGGGLAVLVASDPSSVCLTCHAGPGGSMLPSVFSFDGSALTPGGDFYWMTKTFTWTGGTSPAEGHGHNVVAADFGLTADPVRQVSPGGNFLASQLSCISCHDPHGRSGGGTQGGGKSTAASGSYGKTPPPGQGVGNYRLLGGVGYVGGGYNFIYPAPVARQNELLPFGETDASHVDYGTGMSEWCANCHRAILTSEHQFEGGTFEHPVGSEETLDPEIAANYNSYVRSDDLTGNMATAYLQFVPFERGTDVVELLDPTSPRGPDSSANISCLTCHRAHASAFRVSGRWDFDAALLVNSHPAIGDSGVSAADVDHSYYGRNIDFEFGSGQQSFCTKCHTSGTP